MKRFSALLIAVFLLSAGCASADILTFTTGLAGGGGTLSWGGGASGLVGGGIHVGLLQATGTPTNVGTYFVTGPNTSSCGTLQAIFVGSCGNLEFSTGAVISTTTVGGDTLLNFGPGGSFSLTGGLLNSAIGATTVLLSGQFTGITSYDLNNGVFTASTASGEAFAAPLLQSFFGIHTMIPFQFTMQVLDAAPGLLGAFTQPVSSMQMNTSPVPEPTSIILLVLVLSSCTALVYRNRPSRRQQP